MELNGLIAWTTTFVHYMQIAIEMQNPSLAEISIDSKDLEYMTAILEKLKSFKCGDDIY